MIRLILGWLLTRLALRVLRAAFGTPSDPVGGTVITVAYAVANLLDPIRWLRQLTGNADPPGTGYMVTSDSTTATSWKTGVTAILAVLGYTPVNRAGDTGMTGNFTTNGTVTALGLVAGASGVSAGVGGVATTGPVNPASYTGGSTSTGSPSVKGLNVGTDGIASAGPVNPSQYQGGSTSAGTPSFQGANVGSSGIASTGGITIGGTSVLARSSHTGTQLAATISDLATAVSGMTAAVANTLADGAVATAAKIVNGIITDLKIHADNKDGLANVYSMRTLGTSSVQAAAGNHTHTPMVATGAYNGNGGTQNITGLGFTPDFVQILRINAGSVQFWFMGGLQMVNVAAGGNTVQTSPGFVSDGFTVTNATGTNVSSADYNWVAWGA